MSDEETVVLLVEYRYSKQRGRGGDERASDYKHYEVMLVMRNVTHLEVFCLPLDM